MNARRRFSWPASTAPRLMPKKITIVAACLGLALLIPAPMSGADGQRAQENVDRVAQLLIGKSSIATVKMEISNENGPRNLSMKIWSLGGEKVLIRITSPQQEAGTAILKVGSEIWYYLPKTNRTVMLPPSMTMTSWMGSAFSIDDLVKQNFLTRDYSIATSFEGKRGEVAVYEYTLTPKPEAIVVWGKIVLQVREANLMPAWQGYYDEDGKLVRELTFSDYKTMDGRLMPTHLVMQSANESGVQTTIAYEDISFNKPINDEIFSVDSLKP